MHVILPAGFVGFFFLNTRLEGFVPVRILISRVFLLAFWPDAHSKRYISVLSIIRASCKGGVHCGFIFVPISEDIVHYD